MKKTTQVLSVVAILAIVLTCLTGCISTWGGQVGKPFKVGDTTFVWHGAVVNNPWGADATSLDAFAVDEDDPEPCPTQQYSVPIPAPTVQQPAACQPIAVCQPEEPKFKVRKHAHLVNSNHQGGTGWANGAFKGSVGGLAVGAGIVGGAAALRPARTIMNGGGATAVSSSDASACAVSN